MIHHELMSEQGILIVTPEGAMQQSDFEALSQIVDPIIADAGRLNGLLIYTESFPGWEDFSAMLAHFHFVSDHVKHVSRIAAVTDSGFLAIIPKIADVFVKAKIRHFDFQDKQPALDWLCESKAED